MNIAQIVRERIEKYEDTEPILFREITYDMDEHKSAAYVAINRMINEKRIEQFEKGVYYKPKKTKYGTLQIDRQKLVQKKYIERDNEPTGYITGPELWNQWGLTSQIPKRIWIAKNIRQKRVDEDLNVLLVKAKGLIRKDTIKALQYLDVLDQLEMIPDTTIDTALKKIIEIFKNNFDEEGKLLILEESKKYSKQVQVLVGLIAEAADIDDLYFKAYLKHYKTAVANGKKVILAVKPDVFKNNRSWRNGYATTH
ncbi:MAG: hypothetical protein ACOH15_11570 [Acetobacterium sp.]